MSCSVEQGQDREERGESICPAMLNKAKTERREVSQYVLQC